jgi:hypothetical protein
MALKNKIPINVYSRITILTILFLSISYHSLKAQSNKEDQFPYDQKTEEGTPAFKERLFFGGNLGLMLGTITDIQISPVVGYWLLPRLAIAAGPTYRYYKSTDYYNQVDKTSIYGAKAYAQLVVVHDISSFIPMGSHTGIFLHIEDELLSLKANFWKAPLNPRGRFYVNTVLFGGGISQQIGRRSSMDFMVLWPLNESDYNIYSKPEIRVSFIF